MKTLLALALVAEQTIVGAAAVSAQSCVSETVDIPLPGATGVEIRRADLPSSLFPGLWQEGWYEGYFYRIWANGKADLRADKTLSDWIVTISCDFYTRTCLQVYEGSPPHEAFLTASDLIGCLVPPGARPSQAELDTAATVAVNAPPSPVQEDASDQTAEPDAPPTETPAAEAVPDPAAASETPAESAAATNASVADTATDDAAPPDAPDAPVADAASAAAPPSDAPIDNGIAATVASSPTGTGGGATIAANGTVDATTTRVAPTTSGAFGRPEAAAAFPDTPPPIEDPTPTEFAPSASLEPIARSQSAAGAAPPVTAPAAASTAPQQAAAASSFVPPPGYVLVPIDALAARQASSIAAPARTRVNGPGLVADQPNAAPTVRTPSIHCRLAALPQSDSLLVLQRQLYEAGRDPGPFDGLAGPTTTEALVAVLGPGAENLGIADAIREMDRYLCLNGY